ncbi:MAG: DNA polymerase Y family protein [Betaproteobacteria bacterium]
MRPASTVVAHVWVPGFYAEAETLLNSRPKGTPVVVVGEGKKVMDMSPGARRKGVKPGMSLSVVRLICPEAIEVSYVPERYDSLADSLWETCARHSLAVEPLAQHEAFIDLSGCADVPDAIERISQSIEAIVGSCPAFGVARCKLVARVASGVLEESRRVVHGKTLGSSRRRRTESHPHPEREGRAERLTADPARGLRNVLIVIGKEKEFLAPLPVGVLWTLDDGVIERLQRLGMRRVGDVLAMGRSALVEVLGEPGHVVYELCLGMDRSKVIPVYPKEAITFRKIFDGEVSDESILEHVVEMGAAFIEQRLNAYGATARRWGITLDLTGEGGAGQMVHEQRLSKPSKFYGGGLAICRSLLRAVLAAPDGATRSRSQHGPLRSVRALSLIAADLMPTTTTLQVSIFDPHIAVDRAQAVDAVITRVREKFGAKSLFPASLLECDRRDRLLAAWEACSRYEESKQVASGSNARRPASGEILLEPEMA